MNADTETIATAVEILHEIAEEQDRQAKRRK
jgi:hypothetical protein